MTEDGLDQFGETEIRKLELIAERGSRKELLWELAADGTDYCGVEFVAQEAQIEDRPLEEQVEQFLEDVNEHFETYKDMVNWDTIEKKHGNTADAILSRVKDAGGDQAENGEGGL